MRLLFLFFLMLLPAFPSLAAPQILVTQKPIHSLISGVTEGITEPELLLEEHVASHTYSLKPKDAKKLREADVVFLIDRTMEGYLARPLKSNHKAKVTVIELTKAAGIKLLPARGQILWGDEAEANIPTKKQDPYIWLDPDNAAAIVLLARDVLSKQDPGNKEKYAANAELMLADIKALDAELAGRLAPYSDVSYLVAQDNYQYFEKYYHLKSLGAVTLNTKKELDIRELNKLQALITRHNAVCLFTDPQFPAERASQIADVTEVGIGELDPWGVSLDKGKTLYFELMRMIGNSLTECFDRKRSLMS